MRRKKQPGRSRTNPIKKRKRTAPKLGALPPWAEGAEGSTEHLRRMAAAAHVHITATLNAILATAPKLAARFKRALELMDRFEQLKKTNSLPPKHSREYYKLDNGARCARQFCEAIWIAVMRGVSEPWALESYGEEAIEQFDRSHRSSGRGPTKQQWRILEQAAALIRDRKADSYRSLRRELGRALKGGDISDSAITKALDRWGHLFGPQFARQGS